MADPKVSVRRFNTESDLVRSGKFRDSDFPIADLFLRPRLRLNPSPDKPMYFGADYYPEHWVYPYAGTQEDPESRWEEDAKLMVAAGINVVRM